MSYSIATSIKYKDGKFFGNAGANNVRPFHSYPFEYEDKERFMFDILSGGLDINRVNSKLNSKIKEAISKVKEIHKVGYGKMQEKYMYGWSSINPFSLYCIGSIYFSNKRGDKEEFLKNSSDLSYISKEYHTEKMVEYAIYSTKWDEYVAFYKLLLTVFFNTIEE